MRFRIGVHLGDVMEKTDGTVFGDGVNIASRLEAWPSPAASRYPTRSRVRYAAR